MDHDHSYKLLFSEPRMVADLLEGFVPEGQETLRRAFAAWVRRVLLPARFPGARIPEAADLGEVRIMLAERVIEWTEEWKAEGRAEGRFEILSRLLQLRFGALPAEVLERLRETSPEQLDRLAERILTAASLEDVFGR